MPSTEVKVVLFDLGGVIIELGGLPIRNEWLDSEQSAEECWREWLQSDIAHAFESGRLSAREFSERIVRDMQLTISAKQFLAAFTAWPIGPFPGALELMDRCRQSHVVALFSNSNELHWPRKMGEMSIGDHADHCYASHLMGHAKPSVAAYETVMTNLRTDAGIARPAEVLFLDDNQLNVDAALQMGMQSVRVRGVMESQSALEQYGVLR